MAASMVPSKTDDKRRWSEHVPPQLYERRHDENGNSYKVPLVEHVVVDPSLASGLGDQGATEDVNFFDAKQQPSYEQECRTIRKHITIIKDMIKHYRKPMNFEDEMQVSVWERARGILYRATKNTRVKTWISDSYTREAISERGGFPHLPMAKLVAVVIEECWEGGLYDDRDPTWTVTDKALEAAMNLLTCSEMMGDSEAAMWMRTKEDAKTFRCAIKDLVLEKRPAPVVETAGTNERVMQFESMMRSFSDHEEKMLAVIPFYGKPLDFANDIQMGAWTAILNIIDANWSDVVVRDRIINAAMPDAITMRGFPRMPMIKLLAVIIHEGERHGSYDDTDMFWRVHQDALKETLKILTCEQMTQDSGTTAWLRGERQWVAAWSCMNALRDFILQSVREP